jgi:phospholipid transport system substrate-binding protein
MWRDFVMSRAQRHPSGRPGAKIASAALGAEKRDRRDAGEVSRRRDALRPALGVITVMIALARVAAASEVSAPIEQLDAGLLEVMKAGKATPFQSRCDVLAPLVVRALDLEFILQSAVGAAWASLPPDQQTALRAAFQRYSIAKYVANFEDFPGDRFELLPPTAGGDAVVRVKILPGSPGDQAHVLGYMMRQTAEGWKAVDVTADGISVVAVQQAEFRAVMAMGGIAHLLAGLQQKASELAGEVPR